MRTRVRLTGAGTCVRQPECNLKALPGAQQAWRYGSGFVDTTPNPLALRNKALPALPQPGSDWLDWMPEHVLAPARPKSDVHGAKRSVLVEPVVGMAVVVLVTVIFRNIIALSSEIDYGTASMNEDRRPHIFVVTVPTLVVVRVDDVECFCADAIERKKHEPGIVRIAARRSASLCISPLVVTRRQVRAKKVTLSLAEVVEQASRVARIFDVVLNDPIVLELRLQLTEEDCDQIAVARNELEGPGSPLVGVAERVNGVDSENIVINCYVIENNFPDIRCGRGVEGNDGKGVGGTGLEKSGSEPQQALTGNLDVGRQKQKNVRLILLLSGNSGSIPGGLQGENRGVHDNFGQWLFLFKLRLNTENF